MLKWLCFPDQCVLTPNTPLIYTLQYFIEILPCAKEVIFIAEFAILRMEEFQKYFF